MRNEAGANTEAAAIFPSFCISVRLPFDLMEGMMMESVLTVVQASPEASLGQTSSGMNPCETSMGSWSLLTPSQPPFALPGCWLSVFPALYHV
jgi:hypothetical protein